MDGPEDLFPALAQPHAVGQVLQLAARFSLRHQHKLGHLLFDGSAIFFSGQGINHAPTAIPADGETGVGIGVVERYKTHSPARPVGIGPDKPSWTVGHTLHDLHGTDGPPANVGLLSCRQCRLRPSTLLPLDWSVCFGIDLQSVHYGQSMTPVNGPLCDRPHQTAPPGSYQRWPGPGWCCGMPFFSGGVAGDSSFRHG